jgi:hypothetical protein
VPAQLEAYVQDYATNLSQAFESLPPTVAAGVSSQLRDGVYQFADGLAAQIKLPAEAADQVQQALKRPPLVGQANLMLAEQRARQRGVDAVGFDVPSIRNALLFGGASTVDRLGRDDFLARSSASLRELERAKAEQSQLINSFRANVIMRNALGGVGNVHEGNLFIDKLVGEISQLRQSMDRLRVEQISYQVNRGQSRVDFLGRTGFDLGDWNALLGGMPSFDQAFGGAGRLEMLDGSLSSTRGHLKGMLSDLLATAAAEQQMGGVSDSTRDSVLMVGSALADTQQQWHENRVAMGDFIEMAKDGMRDVRASMESNLGDGIAGLIQGTSDLKDAFRSFVTDVTKIFSDMAAKSLISSLIGNFGGSNGNGGTDFNLGGLLGSLFKGKTAGAADGGVFHGGLTPLHVFADGGIVQAGRPIFGVVGEGGMNEAIVPLPNGRSIPVEVRGGGGDGGSQHGDVYIVDSREKAVEMGYNPSRGDILKVVADDIARGGSVAKAMRRR